ncbi:hypothetical protein BCR33DRAFT_745055 [Rhizoclosmatium globosum]|uniref:Uncharacterized protein n=1 Tax=Rhizoclosmatium globosum TaxID=329046 RepID=A0A1Y2B6I5_9FUNG|nr:hypothetical protein BCR33DRAFT_745055 [Rhizoclosmatium globosum]|eukprot:ORY30150.1 hypothetical protein BCR33DRAFT_745055 [Rhizoclosmatium globosum]
MGDTIKVVIMRFHWTLVALTTPVNSLTSTASVSVLSTFFPTPTTPNATTTSSSLCICATSTPAPTPTLLAYYGGAVLANVEVTPIFYGVSQSFVKDIIAYYNLLVNSTYMDFFEQYNTPTQAIGRGKVVGSYIERNVTKLVTAGSETSCVTFAGYHSIFYAADVAQSVTSVPYGVIPDCTNGTSLPDLLSPISHELAEAVTDPGCGDGWIHPDAGEVGDVCAWMDGTIVDDVGRKWVAQLEWSNVDQRCEIGKPVGVYNVTVPDGSSVSVNTNQFLVKYAGGPLIRNVEITPIFLGPNVTYKNEMVQYYNYIVTSAYMDIFSEYSTKNYTIGRGIALPPYTDPITNSTIDVATTIPSYIRSLIIKGTLKPTNNSFYALHISPNITVTNNSAPLCPSYCAYTKAIYIGDIFKTVKYVIYSVVPDQTGDCSSRCGVSVNGLYNLQSLSSSQLVSAITNGGVGYAMVGWYGEDTGGLADVCMWQQYPFYDSDHKAPKYCYYSSLHTNNDIGFD